MMNEFIYTIPYLGYGFIISIIIVGAMMFFMSKCYPQKAFNVFSYIIALILMFFLVYQFSRMIGAFTLSENISKISSLFLYFLPSMTEQIDSYTSSEINWFVARRILWSLAFLVFGGLGIFKTMYDAGNSSYKSKRYRRNMSQREPRPRRSRR